MSNNTGECNPGLDCNNGNDVNCCKSKVCCKKPTCLDDITTECLFVEKVFDARITKNELQFRLTGDVPIEPMNLVSIETINAECNLLSVQTFIQNININGEKIDITTSVPGPGGPQVVLDRDQLKKILNKKCAEKGKGTKVQLDIFLVLLISIEIVVTGTGIDSNGVLVPFTGSLQFLDQPTLLTLSFKDFCIPPLSLFPISLLTSCLLSCNFVLFDFELEVNDDTEVDIEGGLIFCPTCETLLKVPSQICALTTGPCKIEKSKSFCDDDDFPDDLTSLMPNQKKNVTSSMTKAKSWSTETDNKTQKSPLLASFGTNQFNKMNKKNSNTQLFI